VKIVCGITGITAWQRDAQHVSASKFSNKTLCRHFNVRAPQQPLPAYSPCNEKLHAIRLFNCATFFHGPGRL